MTETILWRSEEVKDPESAALCNAMPRTMLRYAIEKFPPHLRRRFMSKGKN